MEWVRCLWPLAVTLFAVCDFSSARSVYQPNVDPVNGGCVASMWMAAGAPLGRALQYELSLRQYPMPMQALLNPTDSGLYSAGVRRKSDRNAFLRCFRSRPSSRSRRCRTFSLCSGNGVCAPTYGANGRYECRCYSNFTGPACSTARINPTSFQVLPSPRTESHNSCTSNPCLNGGSCVSLGSDNRYNCTCPEGFDGPRCERTRVSPAMFRQMLKKQERIEKMLARILAKSTTLLENQKTQMKADGTVYYKLYKVHLSWNESAEHCKREGGQLASVRSNEQQFMVSSLFGMDSVTMAWLGGTDAGHEGDWRWLNGDRFTYQVWNHANQLSVGELEHCLTLVMYADGHGSTWDDNICSYALPFVCEFH
eukprot:scpid64949/ scgid29363/ Versican core protein; Chondroitin sulfate proteoglycan core protein 2; Large fibroblast proteoglycan; PG-M